MVPPGDKQGWLIKATWLQSVPKLKPALGPDTFVRNWFFQDPPQPATPGSLPSAVGKQRLTGKRCKALERSPRKPAGTRALCAEPKGCGSAELRVRGPRSPPKREPWRLSHSVISNHSLYPRSPKNPFKAGSKPVWGFSSLTPEYTPPPQPLA